MSVPSPRRSRYAADPRRRPDPATARFARGLGWFSLGLGLTELAFGDAIARWLGLPRAGPLIRAYGLREIAQGAGILGAQDPTPWICARVAGDGLDIASVLPALEGDNPRRGNAVIALASLAGVTVADVLCAQALIDAPRMPSEGLRAEYRRRSGFPRPAEAMRGAATDFEPPADIVGPEAMRPWKTAGA
ncbi:cyclase dehydrase [Methylobacterium gregans]|uniref:Cyclase dehydrase n=1 Tax=Methylobacterium gregans TaxID=374424 RepID=A0AA37MHJ7_9HYPH|nr:cyclase dehydrase [Methylobacterium gregans]MDQ0524305.1 hypothetical protein [Methylobacterium gregans]GJD81933.1 hypothetical protein NBEOAGPD_5190 [Methylobacterium gregans]GLS55037.1 hypothetical protein GCM10007886_32210 [Methylobacterium gregans]